MMFSFRFAVLVLLVLVINGQENDSNKNDVNPSVNVEKGYPFGKLRLSEDGKKEELISGTPTEKPQLKPDQSQNVQPLPSPCVGARPLTKLAYPGDKTKYIYCRDEFHYEIFSCPNNGEFNEQRAGCDVVTPVFDRCAEEKPCLNDGQCTVLSNSTFKCTCRPDWSGDRCEIPANSCVKKPCGPNAECRVLKTKDYEQDYVCVCHGTKGYGLNCQEVVPNPCLQGTEQYFPFAFSQHAYVQCDGEVIYFQPCGPLLYWNQEERVCDRKRPPKFNLSAVLKKYGPNDNNNNDDEDSTTTTTTTTTTTEPSVDQEQMQANIRFVPAKVPNRQQGLFAQNQQPQQNRQFGSQQWLNQVPSANTQNDQRFVPQTQSWQNQQQQQQQQEEQFQDQTESTTTTTQTTTTGSSSQGRNFQAWQTQPAGQWNNNQGAQSQTWQTQPTGQWNNNQGTHSQSWQTQPTNQGVQSQPWQNVQGVGSQQPVFTATPSTVNVPSWQTQPTNQWNNNQGTHSQSWQTQPTGQWNNNQGAQSQTWQTQPSNQWNNNQGTHSQSWQTQPNNQWNTNQGVHSQPWQSGQGVGSQQPVFTVTPSPINNQPWQNQNQWNSNQGVQSQPWQQSRNLVSQQPIVPTTTTTPSTLNVSSSSLQDEPMMNQVPQSFQDQTEFQFDTTTTTIRSSVVPTSNWQIKPSNQWNTNVNTPTIGFQPQQTVNYRPSSQSWLSISTQQPILPLTTTTTPQTNVISNNQWNNNQISHTMGLTQQHGAFPTQNSFDQTPSWSQNNFNNQPMMDQRQTPETGYWNNRA